MVWNQHHLQRKGIGMLFCTTRSVSITCTFDWGGMTGWQTTSAVVMCATYIIILFGMMAALFLVNLFGGVPFLIEDDDYDDSAPFKLCYTLVAIQLLMYATVFWYAQQMYGIDAAKGFVFPSALVGTGVFLLFMPVIIGVCKQCDDDVPSRFMMIYTSLFFYAIFFFGPVMMFCRAISGNID